MLKIACEERHCNISHLVVNVGFASTTAYHGPHPWERSEEWQNAILHILHTWKPAYDMRLRCSDPDVPFKLISEKFLSDLRSSHGFDVIYDNDICFVKM